MSGGVDSSVAAYLLKEQGYDVIGVTMQIWQDQDVFVQSQEGGCCGLSAVEDARRVAERLEIPYYVMNFKEDFHKYVIDYLCQNTKSAYTKSVYRLQPLCQVGVTASSITGDWCGLYCHRTLCAYHAAAEWPLYDPQFRYSGEGSDLRTLQSDTGSAFPYPDAGGRL